ncbi:unnamed protein product [Gongylonema pulchrum]|uniref:Uncharacterized protein n=1 Tax=Gongylonema pulchrum TaxID=637853 RepID=A0A3P7M654_9BILA|nr:unnamed protein product [Gongylonema pulchrum]
MTRRHDWFKHPAILLGTIIPWVALIGYLEPHSERMSFAQHRFRVFLQFSTFAVAISIVTLLKLKRWKEGDRE